MNFNRISTTKLRTDIPLRGATQPLRDILLAKFNNDSDDGQALWNQAFSPFQLQYLTNLGINNCNDLRECMRENIRLFHTQSNERQCEIALAGTRENAFGKPCYLCGLNIITRDAVNTWAVVNESSADTHPMYPECEHVFDFKRATFMRIIAKNKGEVSLATKTEYAWSHKCCNQYKSEGHFCIWDNQRNQYIADPQQIAAFYQGLKSGNHSWEKIFRGSNGPLKVDMNGNLRIPAITPNNWVKTARKQYTKVQQRVAEILKDVNHPQIINGQSRGPEYNYKRSYIFCKIFNSMCAATPASALQATLATTIDDDEDELQKRSEFSTPTQKKRSSMYGVGGAQDRYYPGQFNLLLAAAAFDEVASAATARATLKEKADAAAKTPAIILQYQGVIATAATLALTPENVATNSVVELLHQLGQEAKAISAVAEGFNAVANSVKIIDEDRTVVMTATRRRVQPSRRAAAPAAAESAAVAAIALENRLRRTPYIRALLKAYDIAERERKRIAKAAGVLVKLSAAHNMPDFDNETAITVLGTIIEQDIGKPTATTWSGFQNLPMIVILLKRNLPLLYQDLMTTMNHSAFGGITSKVSVRVYLHLIPIIAVIF